MQCQVFLSNMNNFKQIYLTHICGTFKKFPDIFVQAFKIVVDSRTFSMLLLYNLWDGWPIFMIYVQMNSYSSNWNTPY